MAFIFYFGHSSCILVALTYIYLELINHCTTSLFWQLFYKFNSNNPKQDLVNQNETQKSEEQVRRIKQSISLQFSNSDTNITFRWKFRFWNFIRIIVIYLWASFIHITSAIELRQRKRHTCVFDRQIFTEYWNNNNVFVLLPGNSLETVNTFSKICQDIQITCQKY